MPDLNLVTYPILDRIFISKTGFYYRLLEEKEILSKFQRLEKHGDAFIPVHSAYLSWWRQIPNSTVYFQAQELVELSTGSPYI